MAGSVKKDASGKYYFVIDLGKDSNGKRKQKKKRGFKTKKEALAALAEVEVMLNRGTYIEPSQMLFSQYLNEWMKTKKNAIGEQTVETYEFYLKQYIIPKLGSLKLHQLKTTHIQSFINEMQEEEYASDTIKKAHSIIRTALEHAIDMELIIKNVATKVTLPKSKSNAEMQVWNSDELTRFLRVAKEDRKFMVFHLALLCGMRRGEILGLKWRNVDLEKGEIMIVQTLSRDGKKILSGAKSKNSVRTIPIPSVTVGELKKQKAMLEKEKEALDPNYQDNDLVVPSEVGTPINPSNLRRAFERLIKEADVPRIRFHDLRHTHATLLLANGINPKVISERLGHSNIKITLETYSHVLPSMQEEVVAKLDKIMA